MLSTDWYRFSGAAGNQMAESCVEKHRCGTYSPGWLNGSHPTVNEGAVQRRVCFRYRGDCCFFSIYIRVRNCGGFYVYQLKPLTYCYLRYCGNGYVSSTPTTPGTPLPSFFFFLVLIAYSFYGWCIRHSSMKEQTACLQMVKMNGNYSSLFTFTLPHLTYSNRFRPSTWKRYNEGKTIASLSEHASC